MFKDYVVQLLRGVQNVTYIQRNYLHTVIAVDNTNNGQCSGCIQAKDQQ